MNEKEHMVSAKKPAKRHSRAFYLIKMGLVTVILFASAYVVETKLVLTLLSAPTLGNPR